MLHRRQFLSAASAGLGLFGLRGVARAQDEWVNPLLPRQPHFAARAKRVIFLYMGGAPSHVDSFDYKPDLLRDDGKEGRYGGRLLAPRWTFRQRGESGLWISDLFPEVAKQADRLALIRSMQCDQPAHPNAMIQMHTGTAQSIRPSLGAWAVYGLGTENENLPGFMTLAPPSNGAQTYGSAFLPAVFAGARVGRGGRATGFRRSGSGASVEDIANPRLSDREQRAQLDFLRRLHRETDARDHAPADVEGVEQSFELAYRMQSALPALADLSGEDERTLARYGVDGSTTDRFGRQCLLARRLSESGVRFVQVSSSGWDQHTNLTALHKENAESVDRPIAGLLQDLAERGLLEETLVLWGGEFGRTPTAQGSDGRGHNNKGYTVWMAGGGVKGGFSYGATDEHGFEAVENPCHVHDWHATILHLLGLDHERLTFRYAGRDFRLTDVHGNVARELLA